MYTCMGKKFMPPHLSEYICTYVYIHMCNIWKQSSYPCASLHTDVHNTSVYIHMYICTYVYIHMCNIWSSYPCASLHTDVHNTSVYIHMYICTTKKLTFLYLCRPLPLHMYDKKVHTYFFCRALLQKSPTKETYILQRSLHLCRVSTYVYLHMYDQEADTSVPLHTFADLCTLQM